jgi:hypothetical protein
VVDAAKEGKTEPASGGRSLRLCETPKFLVGSCSNKLRSGSINVALLQDFHTRLVNLAFRIDRGGTKHSPDGTIGRLARKLILLSHGRSLSTILWFSVTYRSSFVLVSNMQDSTTVIGLNILPAL